MIDFCLKIYEKNKYDLDFIKFNEDFYIKMKYIFNN